MDRPDHLVDDAATVLWALKWIAGQELARSRPPRSREDDLLVAGELLWPEDLLSAEQAEMRLVREISSLRESRFTAQEEAIVKVLFHGQAVTRAEELDPPWSFRQRLHRRRIGDLRGELISAFGLATTTRDEFRGQFENPVLEKIAHRILESRVGRQRVGDGIKSAGSVAMPGVSTRLQLGESRNALRACGGSSPPIAPAAATPLTDRQLEISTLFWAGNFSEAATLAQALLESGVRSGEPERVAVAVADLVLIARSRGRPAAVSRLLKRHLDAIDMTALDVQYRYRLAKELFVLHQEAGDIASARHHLDELQSIDHDLMLFTPGDDWLPGTIRWRKAHLEWTESPSPTALANAISIAAEGVDYLHDLVRYNPNAAGLASARANLGWLYFLAHDEIAIDFFASAVDGAGIESPRTALEAEIGLVLAQTRFDGVPIPDASRTLVRISSQLDELGFPLRNYDFLKTDPTFGQILEPSVSAVVKRRRAR